MKIIPLIALSLFSFACSKDNPNEDTKIKSKTVEIKNLDATSPDKWIYFSFEKGTIVDITSPETSTTWDIAFFQYYIKTNGGVSGSGKSEVLKTDSKDFTTVTSAPSTGYTADTKGTLTFGSYPNFTTKDDSFSEVMSGGYESNTGYVSISPTNMGTYPSVYAPTKWVYILKTATGKFVKMQVTDFYNDKAKAGFPSFQYQLSSDGKF